MTTKYTKARQFYNCVFVLLVSMVLSTGWATAKSDLSLSFSPAPPQSVPWPGESFTFSLTINNGGDTDASNVEVTNFLPVGLVYETVTPPGTTTFNTGTGVWNIGTVPAGGSYTIDLPVTVTAGGSWQTIAEVTAHTPDDDTDSNPNNNNSAEDDYATACVSAPLPWCQGDSYQLAAPVGLNNFQWFLDGAPINGAMQGTYVANAPGEYTVTAKDANGCDWELCCPVKIIPYCPDVALKKVLATSGNIYPGQNVTFTITVTNQGDVSMSNLEITDYIPTGLTLNDPDWTNNGDGTASYVLPNTLGYAGSGADQTTVDITFTVSSSISAQTIITNFAEVSGAVDSLGHVIDDVDSDLDDDPNNDGPYVDDEINEKPPIDEDDHDPAEITIDIFDLALSKVLSSPLGNIYPGDNVTFTLNVYNQGTADAQNIQITDYIPSGLALNDVDWTDNAGLATLNTPIASLAAAKALRLILPLL
ncbi:MAG: DUF11 domain-containing protein [Sphingobacteriales bacterium]|nr:DUF11 domain-containing protein [Sphingobacteriales bacterium]